MINSKNIAFALCATLALAGTAEAKITRKNAPKKFARFQAGFEKIKNNWQEAVETFDMYKINEAEHEKSMERIVAKKGFVKNCYTYWLESKKSTPFTTCADFLTIDMASLEQLKYTLSRITRKIDTALQSQVKETIRDVNNLIHQLENVRAYVVAHQRYQDEQPRVSLNRTDVIVWN